LKDFIKNNIEVYFLNKNYGIAYAQNIGIKIAEKYNVGFVLLSDQDTIYPANYVEKMFNIYNKLKREKNIAAIAPVYLDLNTMKMQPMVYFNNLILKKSDRIKSIMSVSHVISSGILIPVINFKKIGYMNELLFIDWVDTEWCWRALMLNYEIIQVSEVIIKHEHADLSRKVLWKNVPIHNNKKRNYYRLRNAVYMLFYLNLNIAMKLNLIKRIIIMIPIHLITTNNKKEEIKRIFSSFKDAIRQKLGE